MTEVRRQRSEVGQNLISSIINLQSYILNAKSAKDPQRAQRGKAEMRESGFSSKPVTKSIDPRPCACLRQPGRGLFQIAQV